MVETPPDQPVVLITGASRGIGHVTASLLARDGYRVFGTSRKPSAVGSVGYEMLPLDVCPACGNARAASLSTSGLERGVMNIAALRSMQVTLTAIALASGAGVIAQQNKVPEVKIEATHVVKPVGGISSHGAPIETVQLIRRVSYADLDLATQSGATELEKRINDTARAACAQLLDTLYPVSTSAEPGAEKKSCIRGAVDGAMVQAKAAIVAAESAKGPSN